MAPSDDGLAYYAIRGGLLQNAVRTEVFRHPFRRGQGQRGIFQRMTYGSIEIVPRTPILFE